MATHSHTQLLSLLLIYFSDFSINLMQQFGACCIRFGCVPLLPMLPLLRHAARIHCGCN